MHKTCKSNSNAMNNNADVVDFKNQQSVKPKSIFNNNQERHKTGIK